MKDYISKDILLNVIERNTTWNTNEAFEGLIKNIPTITKAEIRAEVIDDFVNAIKEKFPKDKNAIINVEIIAKQLKEQS